MNNYDFKKIEFWIATGLFLLSVFFLISGIDNRGMAGYNYSLSYRFEVAGLKFHYFENYFIPKFINFSMLYMSFLLLNYKLMPAIFSKTNLSAKVTWLVLWFVSLGLFLSITSTYTRAYVLVNYESLERAYAYLFSIGYVDAITTVLLISFYVGVKTYLPSVLDHIKRKYIHARVYQECLIAVIIWLFVFIILVTQAGRDQRSALWFFGIPLGILQYAFCLGRFIEDQKKRNRGFAGYLWRSLLLIILFSCLLGFLALIIFNESDAFLAIFFANVAVHSLLTTPFCWMMYNYRLKNKSEISFLKQELGKSDANLSFLQSQINPHFLFNALNTLYGTALQENAERTSEGIQKLGDMMRFMLHENVQDRISLARDVDYLKNYIELQKLRTSRSADIVIDVQLQEYYETQEITPMLLIPFVENAFKHGISLQHPSYIKITLQTRDKVLYFDVHNSIHIKADNDPEKFKSGIGLQNVKQRLALLYADKHELIIRESAKEFFIHLTLQL
ncbi:MAG: sensor histidine kinase [Pedobacter sp.]|nr:MAG: sensor histidine kinase [Pedobacter sp.]